MEVRRAYLNDIEALAELFDAYRVFYGQPSDLSLAKSFLTARIAGNESVIFVAEKNDTLLGFVQLYPSFSSVSAKRTWILNDLFVAEAHREQGVAKGLMEAAKTLALETAAKGLTLQTQRDNVHAQKLYESLGYVKSDEFYHYSLRLG